VWKVGRPDGGFFGPSCCLRTAAQNRRRPAIANAFAIADPDRPVSAQSFSLGW